jgi:hypothetical protein
MGPMAFSVIRVVGSVFSDSLFCVFLALKNKGAQLLSALLVEVLDMKCLAPSMHGERV